MTSVHIVSPVGRHPFQAGVNPSESMAALMQSNNDSVAFSNSLPTPSHPVTASPSDSVAYLKHSKPDSSLTSIAHAGLNVSRRGDSLPPMTTPPSTVGPTDRPLDQEKDAERNSSQVAREALGASEKQQQHPLPPPTDAVAVSDHMQVDSHSTPGNAPDAFAAADHAASSLMNTSTVASPGPIEDSASQDGDRPRHRDETELLQDTGNKAFSYPMPTGNLADPRRGLSLPGSGFGKAGQRSPSAKKHRCPYCATEFTRHHNLKSHLLTHSQEKPYVCQTCQSRFRRLHDLKRHTKLHTGERPHICPKCGRRFARGDALARHNKGQGGCAGRRSSMGSYAPDDEYGDPTGPGGPDDSMEGLVYAEPERMDEEDERRLNMPSIKKHDLPAPSGASYPPPRQPSTYPPLAAGRPSPGGLFPPPTSHGGSSASASPVSQPGSLTFPPAGHQATGPPSAFPPAGVADSSPRPLSPNALASHSPPYARTGSISQAPLPPPPGMASSADARFTLHAPPPSAPKPGPDGLPTNGGHRSGPPDGGYVDPGREREDSLWRYIRTVHDELGALKSEVATLRAQLASHSGPTDHSNSLAAPAVSSAQLGGHENSSASPAHR
ncbi:hypothetical protein P168DRAFT_321711 [Aspergillus campestris IBT 28561]|uniref:C2H2-type domain-containing protein n=1 Tax=Aspergillus campestris (strain IBT 28561) TaxID=1392248 RepID=A0A2I1CUJ6_ASPC2|nr:uncharacterized protein P168DRAFT_321711 [Aspergillus campestris IBT 28561]PKY01298.1 hypothetical protein P168DRAFT_321711 [Aspergillus campestris IBT 28561]